MTSNILPSPSIQMARSLHTITLTNTTSTPTTTATTTVSPKIPDTIDSYQLFQYQMECGNTESAVDAMKRLYVVCILHGSSYTTQHIIPYLTQLITLAQQPPPSTSTSTTTTTTPGTLVAANTLSDEMLLLLGQQLLLILQHVTISPQDTMVYTTLMERLCCVEETVVRDQAVIVTQYILQRFATAPDSAKIAAEMLPIWFNVTKRLQSADWFTSKVSCAGILPFVLQLANTVAAGTSITSTSSSTTTTPTSAQIQIIALYRDLCMDETPMVRRAAAKHLGSLLYYAATICTPPSTTTTSAPNPSTDATTTSVYENFASTQVIALCHDEQDSVRLLAVASLAQAGTYYGTHNPQFTIQYWIPIVRDGATDLSWRVRNNLAKHFSDVAKAIGIQGNDAYVSEQNIVMACFVAVLSDTEAEVRTAAVTHLSRMIQWGGTTMYTQHIQALLPNLADDIAMEVRSKCALALMDTAAAADTLDDTIIVQHFGPLYEGFLQDEFHEVQLQVLGNLHKIAHLLPNLSGVVNALLQMAKAANWRVREAVARLLPHLAETRGLDFFNSTLLDSAWLTFLVDPVASVRNSIVSGMSLLVRSVGPEYVSSTILPHLVRIYNQNNNTYLIRITILNALVETALACQSGQLWNEVMLQILRGLVDKVPNVRRIVANGLCRIIKAYNEHGYGDAAMMQTQVVPALQKCVNDETDVDCIPACQDALDQIKM